MSFTCFSKVGISSVCNTLAYQQNHIIRPLSPSLPLLEPVEGLVAIVGYELISIGSFVVDSSVSVQGLWR